MSNQPNGRISLTQTKMPPLPGEPTIYANVTSLALSADEIVVRYGLMNPEIPAEAVGLVRVYMTPGHAKRLAEALAAAVNTYEASFGTIKTSTEDLLTPEARMHLETPNK